MKKLKIISYISILALTAFFLNYIYNNFFTFKDIKEFFNKNYDVTVLGPINKADGMGRQTIDAIELYDSNGMDVNYIRGGTRKLKDLPNSVKFISLFTNNKPGKVVVLEQPLPYKRKYEKKFLKTIFPDSFLTSFNRITKEEQIYLAYSMFESTAIMPHWVELLNKYFDAVVVPAEFLIDVYKESGVKIPIFYLPLGINIGYELSLPLKQSAHKTFRFANLSSMDDRKNQFALIKAFEKVYKNRQDVELVINARNGDKTIIKQIKDYINEQDLNNVVINIESLSQKDYNQLLSTIDCFVYVSKGEGFSVQPREAMAMGVPVIVSDNTAQHDIAKSGLVRVVKSDIKEPAYYGFSVEPVGYNFNVKIDDVADALVDVHDNYHKYLSNAEKARSWAKQYQYSALTPLYISMVKPKKVILGNDNIIDKDFIMTSDITLYNKYLRLINEK
jgi:glycosyltransferase involved in cell wall biosynthesis